MFQSIVNVIPSGWRFPDLCEAKIVFKNKSYQTPGFLTSPLSEKCNIKIDGKVVGNIEVVYIKDVPKSQEGYFLEKESKLIRTIADRIGQTVLYRQMKSVINEWEMSRLNEKNNEKIYREWEVIVDFFYHTDHKMLSHICRKMINYLLINGVKEAYEIFNNSSTSKILDEGYTNYPTAMEPLEDIASIYKKTFNVAKKHLTNNEITMQVKKWIQEVSIYSLIKAICCVSPSLQKIIDELNKYHEAMKGSIPFYSPQERWLNVSLISHILSDKTEFIGIAKKYISYRDFFDIINRIILPVGSKGKLGGKAVGLFLAQKILEKAAEEYPVLSSVKVPKTWYITTDAITEFLHFNNLEELNEQKYKEIHEIRIEYPNIVQLMKNSKLPPEIVKSLSVALDDFGDVPLIVRSSSLLEDQAGTAFSGKYKSLFLSNQGTKKERLEALMDAIIEVYASVFGPDAIQYRAERDLLDFHEEMGILIQEVVGTKVGRYFFPLFSGVAFSYNEYRWSPRIKREDGLVRMVPGLGTRAVDRVSDDFPVLVSPEQPGIRVNIVPEEIKRYSPKKMDVINLEKGIFETVEIASVLKEYGNQIDNINKVVSIFEYDHMRRPNRFEIDFEKDDLVVTFDGIISDSPYIKQLNIMLKTLREKIGLPVDIEFASDGKDLYLLQCRPQSFSQDSAPAPIPKDLPSKDIIFSARRYISNGEINNISYIVYVDPDEYNGLDKLEDLNNVGKVVGLLNSILPKRQFILIGPGRWGSRGDIKLGVRVGYADICNTAALIEVAKRKTGYMPELSFGTHFFQDLVEANIRYLPLYPDDDKTIFNSVFLNKSKNILKEILPEYQYLENVVKVISVPGSSNGRVLKISMNADLEEAVGYLSHHSTARLPEASKNVKPLKYDEHIFTDSAWRWRFYMAENLASTFDPKAFGVKAIYLFGSTNDGTAGPGSDIDLLVHFQGTEQQKREMLNWFQGWSLCLAEMNYLKTGYKMDGLLDIHIITDEDIRNKNSFAIKINSVTDPAYKLKLKS
ncbi:MAG: pyruvate, phosphate dikinase [Clostridiaceae bacterium]|nr:pyruvate, phosphate dikinase [Clostridiaceae bacterium]